MNTNLVEEDEVGYNGVWEVAMATLGMYCRGCGYDLRGQVGGAERCPECGRGFEAGDKRTFRQRPLRGFWWRWARRVAVGLMIVGMVLGGTWGWLYWGWKSEQRAVATFAGTVTWEPLGGRWLRSHLGASGRVLDRATEAILPMSGTDADLAPVSKLTRLRRLDLPFASVTDAGLRHLEHLGHLQVLDLVNTRITDAGLARLGGLTSLQELEVPATSVTDAGISRLGRLHGLTVLGLGYTKVTDRCLETVRQFRALQALNLRETGVTDAGVEQLTGLKNLKFLDLSGTRITDAAFESLKNLKGLDDLSLQGTQVTPAGVAKLQKVLPSCRIAY